MIIYKVTNKLNGKIYIGSTVSSLRMRWRQHCGGHAKGLLVPAIQEYGEQNFTVEILDRADDWIALGIKEKAYIKAFNCLAPHGYNVRSGGENNLQQLEIRLKQSEAAKKRIRRDNGKQMKKFIEAGRNALRGKDPWNKGKKASDETRQKLRDAHLGQSPWNRGKKTPLSVRLKQREAKISLSKPVYCPELDKTWPSLEAASREVEISTIHIKRLIIKRSPSNAKGLSFQYLRLP